MTHSTSKLDKRNHKWNSWWCNFAVYADGKIKSMSSDEVWLLYLDNIGTYHCARFVEHSIKSFAIVANIIDEARNFEAA